MKETKKCSLSGLAFTMEDDAYVMLKEYLESLKRSYGHTPDGNEIIADIEARIAELILSTQDNARVVERPLVANIIAQLGTADAISEESAVDDSATKTPHGEPRIPRRLYRDMDNARLGGVCAGVAKYFKIEIPWVRLACCSPLILIIVGGITPFMHWLDRFGVNLLWVAGISYLIMWIAVPPARTARQKLEANGEKITVQSIREASADSRNADTDRVAKPVIAETVTVLGRIMIFLLKMVAVLIIFALTIAALGLVIGLFAIIVAGAEVFGGMGVTGEILSAINSGQWLGVLAVLVVLIPVVILLYLLLHLLFSSKPGRLTLLVMFLLWIATIIALPVTAIKENLHSIHTDYTYSNSNYVEEQERINDSIDNAASRYQLPAADTVVIRTTAESGSLKSIDLD